MAKMWGNESTHPLLVGVKIFAATGEISVVVPQEVGNLPQDPGVPILGIYPDHSTSY